MSSTSSQDTPVLQIEGMSVRLPAGADRSHAVTDLDLQVAPGEIVCLVGESGSGKSISAFSTMGLLPRGLSVDAGNIRLAGEDLVRDGRRVVDNRRLRALRGTTMSMVFQEPMTALNPVVRCGEQIDELLREHTKLDAGARKARIRQIIEEARLPDPERMMRAWPHRLSGGQRQRIMIALALVLKPRLLIADEPTTALDVTTQARILELIRDLQQQQGTGVLFITHDFGVVAEIADRVLVMQQGRCVEQGPARQVLDHPRHEYTQKLIAAVPGVHPPEIPALAPETLTKLPVVAEADRVGKVYQSMSLFEGRTQVDALRGVSLQVRRGETLGIVGESGSGKSTLARCVSRLIEPTSGRVTIGGTDISHLGVRALHPLRRRVQVVFQDPYRSLNPRRRVGDSIIEGPMNYGQSKAQALSRARELMSLVHLDPQALDRFPHQFSGGQRQRICIARALAMEPELLVADEAVSALDVSVQAQVLKLLDELQQKFQLAILFVTHDLRVAAQTCDTIAVMQNGQVVEHGPAGRLFAAPEHEYTRALLAAAPGWSGSRAKAPDASADRALGPDRA